MKNRGSGTRPVPCLLILPAAFPSPWHQELRGGGQGSPCPAEPTSSSCRHLRVGWFVLQFGVSLVSHTQTAPEPWLPIRARSCAGGFGDQQHGQCLTDKNIPREGREMKADQGAHGSSTNPQMILFKEKATSLAAGQRSTPGKAAKSPTLKQGHWQDL